MYIVDRKRLKTAMLFVFLVPLGSVSELPAESCAEIRASEGDCRQRRTALLDYDRACTDQDRLSVYRHGP